MNKFIGIGISAILFVVFISITAAAENAKATFAGGCFWCMEEPFDKLDGVVSTTSGFTGGGSTAPSYDQVSGGGTGHVEAVEIVYDPQKVTYEQLLDVFWRNIDPSDPKGQFCDRGTQYTTAIFYHDDQQKALAEASKSEIVKTTNKNVVTPILKATQFFPAGKNHQDYYKANAALYKQYKIRCGRERRLREIWGERK